MVRQARLLWWKGEAEACAGGRPLGQLLFYGHSGLTDTSVLLSRALGAGRARLVVSVFGCTLDAVQEKRPFCFHGAEDKAAFEAAIGLAAESKTD